MTTATPPAAGTSGRIGDILVRLGFADRDSIEEMAELARAEHEPIGRLLVERGVISPEQLARAVTQRYGLPFVEILKVDIDPVAAALVPPEVALRYHALPFARSGERLSVAMGNPGDVIALDDLSMLTGCEIDRYGAAPSDLEEVITKLQRERYAVAERGVESAGADTAELVVVESADQAPLINLINSVITRAIDQNASDIHFDWDDDEMHVRYRIDGMAQDVTAVPERLAAGVVSRLKIMAQLDIGERRVPQDGRMGLVVGDADIDVRVVTLPVIHGESVVLRILNRAGHTPQLDELGMAAGARERFDRALALPYGGILVTGPTGSGKTTTLYGALGVLNQREKTIVTIEDPVEYRLDGVKQMQVAPRRGMTFARGLRAILRADPDIVLVGEIRDGETAQIAVEAALTGHLVLTTLHTNDAPTAVTRLIEMGVEPFLVASSVACVVGQRLARVLCTHCRRPAESGGFEAVGCTHCRDTGYSGRIGLYEVMPITPEIARLVLERRSADEIARVAAEQGMRSMLEDGLEKVEQGITSRAEVIRVVAPASM